MSIDIRVQKTTPIPPRVRDAPKRSWHKEVYCRRCGSGIREAHWQFCPNCGQGLEQVAQVTGTNKDDGGMSKTKQRKDKKIYPNDPCPCGSGLKYKQCHGRKPV